MNDTATALRVLLRERYGEAIDVPEDLDGLDALLSMASHATHRAWRADPVEPAMVRLLAACAFSAPSKSYLQQADIVDVRDAAQRRAVEALVPSMPWMAQAPALLVVCGNGRRLRRLFERRGESFPNEHLDAFFNPTADAALVLMNLIRAAESIGLVCCPISVLRDQAQALADLLALPPQVFPLAGLCLGWPAAARGINPRLALGATLHTDRYTAAESDPWVDDFDARYVALQAQRRGAAPATGTAPPSWSQERVTMYGRSQRADWGAFVRRQGFDTT
jgi:nitroreductase